MRTRYIRFFFGLAWLVFSGAGLAATITGRIVDQVSKAGLPGHVIGLSAMGQTEGLREIYQTTSDTNGHFQFEIDTQEPFEGHIWVDDEHAIFWPDRFSNRVHWDGEKQTDAILIERIPTLAVTGRIVTADGEPVAGVSLDSQVERDSGTEYFHAETDASGTFTILLDAGEHLLTMSDTYTYTDPLPLTIAPDESIAFLTITARPASRLEGTLLNPDGTPLGDVFIVAGAWVHTNLIINRAQTDTNGNFIIGIPHPGPLAIHVKAGPDSSHQSLLTSVVVQANAGPMKIVMTAPPGSLSGHIRTDSKSRRMALFTVQADHPSRFWMNTTDLEGNFFLPWLADGEYVISVLGISEEYNYLRRRLLVQDGQATTGVVIEPGQVTLRGQVFGPDGQPATNGLIEINAESNEPSMSWQLRADLGPDGRYAISNLFPGAATIKTMIHGCSVEKSGVVLTGPQHELDVTHSGSNRLTGRLLDAAGEAITNGFVRVFAREGEMKITRAALTDEQGYFSMDHLPDGPCAVSATGSKGYAEPMEFTLPETRDITISFAKAMGYIEGRILSPHEYGSPILITTKTRGGFIIDHMSFTQADGSYLIENVPDGVYQIEVPGMSGTTVESVVVTEGRGVRADIAPPWPW